MVCYHYRDELLGKYLIKFRIKAVGVFSNYCLTHQACNYKSLISWIFDVLPVLPSYLIRALQQFRLPLQVICEIGSRLRKLLEFILAKVTAVMQNITPVAPLSASVCHSCSVHLKLDIFSDRWQLRKQTRCLLTCSQKSSDTVPYILRGCYNFSFFIYNLTHSEQLLESRIQLDTVQSCDAIYH